MDVTSVAVLVSIGLFVVAAITIALCVVWFLLYVQFYAGSLIFYSFETVDPQISQHATLLFSAVLDVGSFTVTSFQSFARIIATEVLSRLPLIFGLLLLSFGAMAATEYHDVIITVAMNLYQGLVTWSLYDLRLMRLVNVVRVVLDIIYPVLEFIGALTLYLTRTWITEAFFCSVNDLIADAQEIGFGGVEVIQGFAIWFGANNSLTDPNAPPPDTENGWRRVLDGATGAPLSLLNCICAQLDFIWNILFLWIQSKGTRDLLVNLTHLVGAVLVLPIRIATSTNPGTVAGVTTDYGFVPNLEQIFDILCRIINNLADVLNAILFYLVSEIAGKADPTLFQPGSQEAVVLAYDWFGFIGELACTALEIVRLAYRIAWAAALVIIAGLAALLELIIGGTVEPPVPIFCDLREWRALFDAGGRSGIYYKQSGVGGRFQRAMDHLEALFVHASTYAANLVVPPLRAVGDLVTGTWNFVARFLFHAFDSEFRQFSSIIPPRTGLPVSGWTPPLPPLPPNTPLNCDTFSAVRGNVWVWIQHFVDDPDGSVRLFVDAHGVAWAQGWYDLGALWDPGLGTFLQNLFLIVFYGIDFVIQSLAHINVTFESFSSYTLWASRWRYDRFLKAWRFFGDGFGDTFRRVHAEIPPNVPCVDPEDGFFCAFGSVFDAAFGLVDGIINQIIYFFVQARLLDYRMPNFLQAINDLVEGVDALVAFAAFAIPPLPLINTDLSEVVSILLRSAVFVVSYVLYLPNYIIYTLQPVVDAFEASASSSTIALAFESWFINWLDHAILELVRRLCSDPENGDPEWGLLFAVAQALDAFGGVVVFRGLMQAVCAILDAIVILVQSFALEVLSCVFRLIGALINLFFSDNTTTLGARLETFLEAFLACIELFLQLPGLIFDVIIGLIERIPFFGPVIATFLRLLAGGLCFVLQGLITGVIAFLNFFGAGLSAVDLQCPTVKRDANGTPAPDVARDVTQFLESRYAQQKEREVKLSRKHAHLAERIQKLRHLHPEIDDQGDPEVFLGGKRQTGALSNTTIALLAQRGGSNSTQNASRVSISMDEAVVLLGDLVEWQGMSFCDIMMRQMASRELVLDELSMLERTHFQDCVGRRAAGEFISYMPGAQWFPPAGFYDAFSWAKLASDAVRVFSIWQQMQQDVGMPREVVLGDAYKTKWESMGLRVDHLTADNYNRIINNMTFYEYVERNDGNIDIVEALEDTVWLLREGVSHYNEYLTDISRNVVEEDARMHSGPLEDWLYGEAAEEEERATMSEDAQLVQEIWRATLRITASAANLTVGTYNAASDAGLVGKTYDAAATVPSMLKRGAQWMLSPTEKQQRDWEQAVIKRDAVMEAKGFNALSHVWQKHAPKKLATRLSDWARERVLTAARKLKPNDARARRNWAIVIQFVRDVINALHFGALDSENRPYTPSYATGSFVTDPETGLFVSQVSPCGENPVVPFCLDCALLDGLFEETVLAARRFRDYWTQQWPLQFQRYLQTDAYVSDDTINVCGGDGTQTIRWPSTIEVDNSGTTVIDVFGHPDGAVAGIVDYVGALVLEGIGIASLSSREAIYETIEYLVAPGTSKANTAFSTKSQENRNRQRALAVDYITQYTETHVEFDPTYAVTRLFDATLVTQTLDDLFNFIGGVAVSFENGDAVFESNLTIPIPRITPALGQETGFFGEFVSNVYTADLDYNCDDRFLTLKQGILLFALLGLITFFVVLGIRGCLPESTITSLMTGIFVTIGVIVAIVVIYGIPAQNLLVGIYPECLPGDVLDVIVCDALPKCPAIVAGLVLDDYTEANCRTLPFEPDIGNCKRNFDVRHIGDSAALLLEILSRPFMRTIRNPEGIGVVLSPAFSLVGIDTSRYANTDFTDPKTFDTSIACLILISAFSIPVIALAYLVNTIIVSPVLTFLLGFIFRGVNIVIFLYLIARDILSTLSMNLIFVTTPLQRVALRRELRQTPAPSVSQGARQAFDQADDTVGLTDMASGREEERIFSNGLRFRKRASGLST